MSQVGSTPGVVSEVAGPAFTPVETAAAIVLGVVSLLMAGLLSLLLGALAEEHRLTAAGIGLTAMTEALVTGLATALCGIVLKPRRLRMIGVAASVLLAAANLATVGVSGGGLMLIRALAGVPEGVLLWITVGMIARTATPERWAGVLFTAMPLAQLAFAALLSGWILPRFGADGGYRVLAAASLVGVFAALVSRSAYGLLPDGGSGTGAPPPRGWVALVVTLAFTAAFSAVAVYIAPLAHQAGLGVGVSRTAITASLAFQVAGGALATAIAGRVRYLTVFAACSGAVLASWAVFALVAPAWGFVGAASVAALAATVVGPFFVPMTIEADPSRRAAVQSGAIQLLAGALGPLLAAVLVSDQEVRQVLALGAALVLIGLGVAAGLHRTARSTAA